MIALCCSDALAEGACKGFLVDTGGNDRVFALRRDGAVLVYQNQCPHEGTTLEYRKDHFLSPDRRYITCYLHGALFEPGTGQCVAGPCRGQALVRLPCLERDGQIFVDIADAMSGITTSSLKLNGVKHGSN